MLMIIAAAVVFEDDQPRLAHAPLGDAEHRAEIRARDGGADVLACALRRTPH